jgi:prevent-host-death family protein
MLMTMVNVHEAKTHFSKLLSRAHAGEEIIVAKAGKPFARLMPLRDLEERLPGRYKDAIPDSFFDDLPEDELKEWEK